MATLRTVTVGPGRDYTTLSACEAAERADLVALDRELRIELYPMVDTTAVYFDGTNWNSNFANGQYVHFVQMGTRTGVWDEVNSYVLKVDRTFFGVLRVGMDCWVDGLLFENTNASGSNPLGFAIVGHHTAGTGRAVVENCIARHLGGTTGDGFDVQPSHWHHLEYRNNLAYGWANHGFAMDQTVAGGTLVLDNNTAVGNGGTGFRFQSYQAVNVVRIRNNCAQGNGTDYSDDNGSFWFTNPAATDVVIDTNLSADTTAPTGNEIHSAAVTFANAGADDYHLDPTDTAARGLGLNLTGDAYWPAAVDYEGDVRPAAGTWDIGADEVAQGGFRFYDDLGAPLGAEGVNIQVQAGTAIIAQMQTVGIDSVSRKRELRRSVDGGPFRRVGWMGTVEDFFADTQVAGTFNPIVGDCGGELTMSADAIHLTGVLEGKDAIQIGAFTASDTTGLGVLAETGFTVGWIGDYTAVNDQGMCHFFVGGDYPNRTVSATIKSTKFQLELNRGGVMELLATSFDALIGATYAHIVSWDPVTRVLIWWINGYKALTLNATAGIGTGVGFDSYATEGANSRAGWWFISDHILTTEQEVTDIYNHLLTYVDRSYTAKAMRLSTAAGTYFSTSDDPTLEVGANDAIWRVAFEVEDASGSTALASKFDFNTNDRSWLLYMNAGDLVVTCSVDGIAESTATSTGFTFLADTPYFAEWAYNATAGTMAISWKAGTHPDDMDADTGWTALGVTLSGAAIPNSLHNATAPIEIGSYNAGALGNRDQVVSRLLMRVGGADVYDANPSGQVGSLAAASYLDDVGGLTVTANGEASVILR